MSSYDANCMPPDASARTARGNSPENRDLGPSDSAILNNSVIGLVVSEESTVTSFIPSVILFVSTACASVRDIILVRTTSSYSDHTVERGV